MDKQEINRLLENYVQGLCTPEECTLVEQLLDRMAAGMPLPGNQPEMESVGAELFERLEAKREQLFPGRGRGRVKAVWFAAASVLLLFCLSVFLWDRVQAPSFTATPIKPAGNKAKITLSNGQEVALDEKDSVIIMRDGDAHYRNGKSVTMAKEQSFRLETPKGGIYQLVLEDGTHVWLNAASAITYPANFAEKRVIELEGEAYFAVAKAKEGSATVAKPFLVKAGEQLITVLGTEFNVLAYAGQPAIQTTLASGKVRIATLQKEVPSVELKPAERATFQSGVFRVDVVDLDEELAWMNKKFVFNDEPLYSIMQRIARWYDLEVEFQGVDRNQRFGGTVSCFEDVRTVLEKLELTKGVHFKVEGRRVLVMP